MNNKSLLLLLVEDNPMDARLISELLKESSPGKYSLIHVESLKPGVETLSRELPDIILLDLGLPDSQGLNTLINIVSQTLDVPVIVLTGLHDEEMALRAVQVGAQDYLIKGEFNGDLLRRVILHSIERKHMENTLRNSETELKNRNTQLAMIDRGLNSLILGTSFDLAKLCQLMVDTITQELGDVFCSLYMCTQPDDELTLCATSFATSKQFTKTNAGIEGRGLLTQAIHSKVSIYISDTNKQSVDISDWEGIRSVMVTPLKVGEKIIGILSIMSPEPGFLTSIREQMLLLFSNQGAIVLENAKLMVETKTQVDRLESLRKIDETISASLDLHVTAEVILAEIKKHLNVDAANFLLFNPGSRSLSFVANIGFNTSALQHSDLRLGQGLAGRAADLRQTIHISNLAEQEDFFNASPHLNEEKFIEYYGVPLIAKGTLKGLLEIFNRSQLSTNESWQNFLVTLAGQAAIAIDNVELFDNLQKSINRLTLAYDESIEAWSRALDLRDKETEGHTQRVVKITIGLAKAMGIDGEELVHIRRGALLHDIGKMGIPDNILLKPGPLTEAEWLIMRKHSDYSFELLSPIAFLKPALDIPYCHHEKWDGSGYPRGLKGNQIPLAARLFAVADVWDALRSDRPYRASWPEKKAYDYIRGQAGTHFDPNIVELFLANFIFDSISQKKPDTLPVNEQQNFAKTSANFVMESISALTANSVEETVEIVKHSDPAEVENLCEVLNNAVNQYLNIVHAYRDSVEGISTSRLTQNQ
ncbi:MAG: GAF domain-containing protein [Anaerolineaceae bacterium]|nr:GAF domain-containing protein [Anaerolineaceae bacterium]